MTKLTSGSDGASAFLPLRAAALAISFMMPTHSAAQLADEPAAPEQAVAIEPVVRDEAIEERIGRILKATGWYRSVDIAVDEGIVFLDGIAGSQEQRTWARDLAARTEGTVAVVNRIEVREEVSWNLAPAFSEIEALARRIAVALPLIALAVLVLPLA